MRILDRYVTISFLKNYFLSFFVLIGMYIVLDMVFNFEDFATVKVKLGSTSALVLYVAEFYFYQILVYFVHLAGIIPLVAAAFTLMRMIRFNEVSAMLSAGVPLPRLALPIVVCALALNGLLYLDQEVLLPQNLNKVVRRRTYVDESATWHAINAMREPVRDATGTTRTLFAARYFPNASPPYMERMHVITKDSTYMPVEHLLADRAEWNSAENHWRLINGSVRTNISPRQNLEILSRPRAVWDTSINPMEIRLFRRGDYVELLSTAQINELLKRPDSYGRENLLQVKHARGPAQIALNMVVLLLACGAVLTRDPLTLKGAAVKCIVLCGLCLGSAFIGQELSGHAELAGPLAPHWPALMAWFPVFIFAPVAVFMLDRVKT